MNYEYKQKGIIFIIKLQILAAVFAFIAIFIGEYLIVNHYFYGFFGTILIKMSYLDYLLIVIQVMFEVLKKDVLGIFFWVIVIYAGFTVPRKK